MSFYEVLIEDVANTLPLNYKQAGILVEFANEQCRPDREAIIKMVADLKTLINDLNEASGDDIPQRKKV